MKIIIKTKRGYYKVLNNGNFIDDEIRENATIITTKMQLILIEETLNNHHVKYIKEATE